MESINLVRRDNDKLMKEADLIIAHGPEFISIYVGKTRAETLDKPFMMFKTSWRKDLYQECGGD